MRAPAAWLYLDANGFFVSCDGATDVRVRGRPVRVVAGATYVEAPLIAVKKVARRPGVGLVQRYTDLTAQLRHAEDATRCLCSRGEAASR